MATVTESAAGIALLVAAVGAFHACVGAIGQGVRWLSGSRDHIGRRQLMQRAADNPHDVALFLLGLALKPGLLLLAVGLVTFVPLWVLGLAT